MEIIYLVLFFSAPGLIIKAINDYKQITGNKTDKSKTIYERLFLIVTHSVIISIICIGIMKLFHTAMGYNFPVTISSLMDSFDIIKIFLSYLVLMIVVTIIYDKIISCKKLKNWTMKIYNKHFEKEYGVKKATADNLTVWEDIFFNAEINKNPLVVTIYKDGVYITSGIIMSWNSAISDPNELKIVRSTEIEHVLEIDKSRMQKDKWLHDIDFEFFDCESGLLIKFYSTERVLKHWDEISL